MELDGLRGIAVLLVIACHSVAPDTVLASAGSVGVTMFFTLSGFLISTLLFDELESDEELNLLRFLRHRVLRLVPALAVVVLAVAIFLLAIGASSAQVLAVSLPPLLYLQNWLTMFESPRVSWRLGYLEPAPVGTGVST